MLKVDTVCMETQAQQMQIIATQLNDISSRVAAVNQKLRWNTNIAAVVRLSLTACSTSISGLDDKSDRLAQALVSAAGQYAQAEESAAACAEGQDVRTLYAAPAASTILLGDNESMEKRDLLGTFKDEFLSNYGWKEALKGAGYIGTIYNFVQDIKNGKSWRDLGKTGVQMYEFLSSAIVKYQNYKKIGNAVGTKKAMAWWLKSIVGMKPLGRASTAKNPFTRFVNNLTNKTSPFNAQLKNAVGNFTGANGVGKAVASWGAVVMNGALNLVSNREEQASSGGKMSDGRVWAETIMETAVDTVLMNGAGIVVGAAVTTALGTAAAPGVLVVAASGAVVAGLNAGVKALTGKTTTEWISDSILDAGEAVGKAAKNVVSSVGSWFGKLSFA